MGRSQARPGGQWCPGLSLSSLSCVASPLRSQNSAREAGRGGSPITVRRLRQRGMFLPAHQPWMPPAKLAAPPRAHKSPPTPTTIPFMKSAKQILKKFFLWFYTYKRSTSVGGSAVLIHQLEMWLPSFNRRHGILEMANSGAPRQAAWRVCAPLLLHAPSSCLWELGTWFHLEKVEGRSAGGRAGRRASAWLHGGQADCRAQGGRCRAGQLSPPGGTEGESGNWRASGS